jgi:hypothetical protein
VKRAKTPSFILELPLKATAHDTRVLIKVFEAGRQLYNSCPLFPAAVLKSKHLNGAAHMRIFLCKLRQFFKKKRLNGIKM